MDFHLFLMFSVLIMILVETFLSTRWVPFYFVKGLTLFSKRFRYQTSNIDIQELTNSLNSGFKKSWYSQSMIFQGIDDKAIAFREKMFEFSFFTYTPLMHGNIVINSHKKTIQVKGVSNWFPIAFTILWYSAVLQGFSFQRDFIFLVAPMILFGIIYLVQVARFNKIYNFLNDTKDK